jgi:predicted nucleic acid-binding protein
VNRTDLPLPIPSLPPATPPRQVASGETAVANLARLPLSIAGTAALIEDAWQLRSSVTVYDACYVALASRLQAPLVTADRKLARAASRRTRVVLLDELDALPG